MQVNYLNSASLSLLEKVAIFGERRQEILAGNIANINTPDYKTQDLPVDEFRNALKDAIGQLQSQQQAASLYSTTPSNQETIDQTIHDDLFRSQTIPNENITFQDGGNRSVEQQVMKMTKNLMMQNFAIQLMNAQMGMLDTAITEHL